MTGGSSIVFTQKALVVRVLVVGLLSEAHQIYVNPSLELMQASFTV